MEDARWKFVYGMQKIVSENGTCKMYCGTWKKYIIYESRFSVTFELIYHFRDFHKSLHVLYVNQMSSGHCCIIPRLFHCRPLRFVI